MRLWILQWEEREMERVVRFSVLVLLGRVTLIDFGDEIHQNDIIVNTTLSEDVL